MIFFLLSFTILSGSFDFPKYKWVNTFGKSTLDTNLDFITPMIHAMEALLKEPINVNQMLINLTQNYPKEIDTRELYDWFTGKKTYPNTNTDRPKVALNTTAFLDVYNRELQNVTADFNIFNSLGARCTLLMIMVGTFGVANLVLLILSNCRALPEETAKPNCVKTTFFYLGCIFVLSIAFFAILSVFPILSIKQDVNGLSDMIPAAVQATKTQMDIVIDNSTLNYNAIADGVRDFAHQASNINESIQKVIKNMFDDTMSDIFQSNSSIFNQFTVNQKISSLITEINENIDSSTKKLTLKEDMENCKQNMISKWENSTLEARQLFDGYLYFAELISNISAVGQWDNPTNITEFFSVPIDFLEKFKTKELIEENYPKAYDAIYGNTEKVNIITIILIIVILIFAVIHIILTVIYILSFHNCWKYSAFVSKYVCIHPCCCLVPFSSIGILSGIAATTLILLATLIVHVPDAALNALADRFDNRSITIPQFAITYLAENENITIKTDPLTFPIPENLTLFIDFLNSYPTETFAEFLHFREFFKLDELNKMLNRIHLDIQHFYDVCTGPFFAVLAEDKTAFLTNISSFNEIEQLPDYKNQIEEAKLFFESKKDTEMIEKLALLQQEIEKSIDSSFQYTIKTAKNVIEIPKKSTFYSDNFQEFAEPYFDDIFSIITNSTLFINQILNIVQVGIINGPLAYLSNIVFFDSTNLFILFTLGTLCGFVGFFLILLMLRVLRSGMPVPYAMVVPLNDLDMYEPAEPNEKNDENDPYDSYK